MWLPAIWRSVNCANTSGAESFKALERPREDTANGGKWDIADTFGEDNTRERIDQDLESGKAILRGYAATITPPPVE